MSASDDFQEVQRLVEDVQLTMQQAVWLGCQPLTKEEMAKAALMLKAYEILYQ